MDGGKGEGKRPTDLLDELAVEELVAGCGLHSESTSASRMLKVYTSKIRIRGAMVWIWYALCTYALRCVQECIAPVRRLIKGFQGISGSARKRR